MKLYRHEASRGLFATAELFVHYLSGKYHTTTWQRRLQTKCFMGLGIHGPGIQGGSRREVLGGLTSIVRIYQLGNTAYVGIASSSNKNSQIRELPTFWGVCPLGPPWNCQCDLVRLMWQIWEIFRLSVADASREDTSSHRQGCIDVPCALLVVSRNRESGGRRSLLVVMVSRGRGSGG